MFKPLWVHEAVGCCPVHLGRFMWGREVLVFYGFLLKFLRKHLVDYFSLLLQIRDFTENRCLNYASSPHAYSGMHPMWSINMSKSLYSLNQVCCNMGSKMIWCTFGTLVIHPVTRIEWTFIMGVSSNSWWCAGYKKLLQPANLRVIISGEFP